ncbi:hypothetical protein [Chlorobium phaeovibrioides]|uniref:Uncharacterized protein n=1 Tax=Chlorobium phaeovibrioides TaxID=1094 RepID=A0ABW9UTJ1_CHLPH|nr:hypothetical protein [Chlorobium phaeovibrioides]MWV54761.1 hypothetical protein [Chlorobium phaeovibrioides]
MAPEQRSVMFSRCSRQSSTHDSPQTGEERCGREERHRSGELMEDHCSCCELPRADCRAGGRESVGGGTVYCMEKAYILTVC